MKKLFALCLTIVLCLCCLASCGSAHKENTWFSEEKLTECLVGDLPTITKDCVNHNDEDIYVSFTDSEFEAYAKSVYDYLLSQEYKYLGTRGEQKGTLAGALTTYYFEPATELSEFYVSGSYKFVYSDGSLDEDGKLIFCIISLYDYETKTLEYGTKDFLYNTLITLRYKSETPLSGFYVLKEEEMCEHIWDDGIEVEGGIGGYVMEYTCTVCGKKDQQIITIIPPYPVTEDDIVDKVYVYEKEGCGGDFTIEIKADGTFAYYEGMLSSHKGSGEWSYADGMLTLFEKVYRLNETGEWEQVTKSYSFGVEKDTLIFVDKGLDMGLGNFLYVKVKHGEKFYAQ